MNMAALLVVTCPRAATFGLLTNAFTKHRWTPINLFSRSSYNIINYGCGRQHINHIARAWGRQRKYQRRKNKNEIDSLLKQLRLSPTQRTLYLLAQQFLICTWAEDKRRWHKESGFIAALRAKDEDNRDAALTIAAPSIESLLFRSAGR